MANPTADLVSRLRAKAAKGGIIPIHDVTIVEAADELQRLLSVEHLAKHLDAVICEFGTEPAYIAEAVQALHDKLKGGRGFYQVCNVCGGVPVPGTGRCRSHTDDVPAPLKPWTCNNCSITFSGHREKCDYCGAARPADTRG